MKKNIQYKTNQLVEYFSNNRRHWDDFYPSEKWIFEQIAGPKRRVGKVLDVGCAVGGLGQALLERFTVDQYVGVDINTQMIDIANTKGKGIEYPPGSCSFICGDILDINSLCPEGFDHVVSLSCADWNIATQEIITGCWKYVRKGGCFILTLRLTKGKSLFDFSESFQYIYFGTSLPDNLAEIERAPYVVFNVGDAFSLLMDLKPKPVHIKAYGYWGTPSPTARTKYDRLVFAALAIRKGYRDDPSDHPDGELYLPIDLFYKE